MNQGQFLEYRKMTRIALPEDDSYLYHLGIALYGFASINSFMCEVIAHLNTEYNHTNLQDKDSGSILRIFRNELELLQKTGKLTTIHAIMQDTADLFERLNAQRNDIVHAYPITSSSGMQILHRRKDSEGKYFEVTNGFLEDFISSLHNVSSGLYAIRDAVRSNT